MLAIAYPTKVPGFSETFIREPIDYLRGRGIAVTEYSGGYLPHQLREPGRAESLIMDPLQRILGSGVPELGLRRVLVRRLVGSMQKRETRAILAHYGPTALSLLPVARRAGLPLWVYFHGYDVWRARERRRYAPGYPALFREMAGSFAASQAIADQLLAWGARPKKVHYLPCGVQEVFFQAQPQTEGQPPRILFAARWAATKGLFTLLEAYLQIVEARPDAVLTLAGDGPLRRQVLHKLKQLNLTDWVELPGVLSREALLAAMERSQVAVLPSERAADGDSEGTPLFLLEAAAAGLPIVATAHQGIGEVFVHGRHALLVPEKKPAALADALLDVLNHPQPARIRAEEARKWVASGFRMSTQWDQIIAHIGLT